MLVSRVHNFHVPLSPRLYESLRRESAREGRPATELARAAIEAFVRMRQRRELHEAIASYAADTAGTSMDLDVELEQVGIERLLKQKRDR